MARQAKPRMHAAARRSQRPRVSTRPSSANTPHAPAETRRRDILGCLNPRRRIKLDCKRGRQENPHQDELADHQACQHDSVHGRPAGFEQSLGGRASANRAHGHPHQTQNAERQAERLQAPWVGESAQQSPRMFDEPVLAIEPRCGQPDDGDAQHFLEGAEQSTSGFRPRLHEPERRQPEQAEGARCQRRPIQMSDHAQRQHRGDQRGSGQGSLKESRAFRIGVGRAEPAERQRREKSEGRMREQRERWPRRWQLEMLGEFVCHRSKYEERGDPRKARAVITPCEREDARRQQDARACVERRGPITNVPTTSSRDNIAPATAGPGSAMKASYHAGSASALRRTAAIAAIAMKADAVARLNAIHDNF